MNTYIKLPIDYKNIDWTKISPVLILNSAKFYYKETKAKIKLLELKNVSDEEYLHCIDEYSNNVAKFNYLVAFLKNSGSIEYSKIDNKIRQLQLKIHYQIFSNPKIYKNFKAIKKETLKDEDQYFIEVTDKTFQYAGVNLSSSDKAKMIQTDKQLTNEQTKYQNNCVKSADNLILKVSRNDYIANFDDKTVELLKKNKKIKQKNIILNEPNFIEIIQNCKSDKIRKKAMCIYHDAGSKGKYSNVEVVNKILQLEKIAPKLLGYKNATDFALSERVLNSTEKVESLLLKLHSKLKPIAQKELAILVKEKGSKLEGSDTDFYVKKYKEKHFNINFKDISKYFSFNNVFKYLLGLNKELFGVEFIQRKYNTPHEGMLTYDIFDTATRKKMGYIYIDVVCRKNKEAGAWATELIYNKQTQEHVLYLGANLDAEDNNLDNLFLDIDEIQTLFHEMGHILHFTCPKVKYHAYSSEFTEWDFIELPSQLYEKWVTNPEILQEMSCHYQTNKKIELDQITKILESSNLFKAIDYQYLISKSILDLKVHGQAKISSVAKLEYKILKRYQPIAPFKNISRLMSFSHFFGGGYDVGYYSYVYANILDSNVWQLFLDSGIRNKETSLNFRKQVLDVGASKPAQTQIDKLLGSVSIEPFIKSFKTDY